MKNNKSISSGVVIGLLYSIITIGSGVFIGFMLAMSGAIKTNSIISVIRLIVNFIIQNNYSVGLLGIRIPNNILVLFLISLFLYQLTNKKLQYFNKIDLIVFVASVTLTISLITALFQAVCSYIEVSNVNTTIEFGNLLKEIAIIIIRQFILYGIILCVILIYAYRKLLVQCGYQAIFTYIKFVLLAMFLFSVIVLVDLFWSISMNGRIEGLGQTIGSINFSGRTAVFIIFGLLLSIGNIMGFLTGITFGGDLIQSYEFFKQQEVSRIGLYEILTGQLGEYSIILFSVCILMVVSIILLAAWRLQKANYFKNAFILTIGVVLTNVILVELSNSSFEFKDIIRLRISISTFPIAMISLLGTIIAISIRYIFLAARKADEKDVVS